MTDSELSTGNPPPPKKFGRRQALQMLGFGAAGLVGAGVGTVVGIDNTSAQPENFSSDHLRLVEVQGGIGSPEDRLEKSGFKDFIPMYRRSVAFSQKYGILPPFFQSLQNTLICVAQASENIENSEEYKKFSAEWGVKREELPNAAAEAFNQFEYSFDPSVNEKEQMRVKEIAKNVCQSFPMLAIAAPAVIEHGGSPNERCKREIVLGCTDGDTFLHSGNKGEIDYAEILIHELNHNFLDDFDINPENFQYVTKQETTAYFEYVTSMIDRFYTSVATDLSETPAEYLFGYNSWVERQEAIGLAKGVKEMLDVDVVMNVGTSNPDALVEPVEYNMILRRSLQRLLLDKDNLEESERQQLSLLIGTDMKFVLHALHNPTLRERSLAGSNSNAIAQQFLDLGTEYQRAWVQFVSSGRVGGTTSISELRGMCGLSPDGIKNNLINEEIPQMFDYEQFGCVKRGEGFIEEGVWYELHELPESPYDSENRYMVWEVFDSFYTKDNGNHILLFAIPKHLDLSQLQVSFESDVASITFPDGEKVTARVEINTEDDVKKVNIDSTSISNAKGEIVNIWDKEERKLTPEWTHANIGEVGPLGKLSPAIDIPCIMTSDPKLPYAHYYASGDNRPIDSSLPIEIASLGETAIILPTEKGFQLLFRALPHNLIDKINKASNVEQVVDLLAVSGAEMLGKDQFIQRYKDRPVDVKMTPRYYRASGKDNGIIWSIVVGSEGKVRMYPLETNEFA